MELSSAKRPRYLEISDAIEKRIRQGTLTANAKLPTEKELCDEWQVSSITVRRSLSELAKKKLVVTRHGLGSFVAVPPMEDRSGRDNILGLVIPSSSDYHNGRMVDGVERTARELGYSVLIKHSRNIPAEETECINLLLDRKVMGLLISPVTGDYSETLVSCAKLMAGKVPFVLVDRFLPILKTPYVTTDNERGGYEVTKHLIELGHRKIGFLKNLSCSSSDAREQGYRRALLEAGIPIDLRLIVGDIDYSDEACCRGVYQLFEQAGGDITAIFGENDGLARAVYEVFRNKGIQVCDDIAVAGFDDAPFAKLLIPGLTTVFQPDTLIAEQAVRLLQTLILGQSVDQMQMTFQPKLIIRGSTQKAVEETSRYGVGQNQFPGRGTKPRELGQV